MAHHLTNPYDEDLVYLMGGESSSFDIGSFPRIGRKLIFSAGKIYAVDEADLQPMSFDQYLPEGLPEGLRNGSKEGA
ncbi:MAG: hypothetical protein QOK29_1913 [Rhodospirillaceae bacterium]|nr:hypothetical protein [Rhodospirillaceae bacterium]